jgi:dipeptidyl aminopeptidase/acylaminoacyl peptidase
MSKVRRFSIAVAAVLLWPLVSSGQSLADLYTLVHARSLELSSDGTRLWYQLGEDWWEVATNSDTAPIRLARHDPAPAPAKPAQVPVTKTATGISVSPDGKKIAYLDTDAGDKIPGPTYLFCLCGQTVTGSLRPITRMPVLAFRWDDDSESFWIIAGDGPDEPVGHLSASGQFERITQDPALRRRGGFAAANGVIAWVQSDGSCYSAIWIRDRLGRVRLRVDPNPQTARWRLGQQQVIRWKNSHGEELHGVLVRPNNGRAPLIVDPYSSGRNGFLSTPLLANYLFVKEGFAIFLPNHRAPHTLPGAMFGMDYVGESKDRDPIDVLIDDVMSGVNELIRQGVADPDRLFLYGYSNGSTAVDQILAHTKVFKAAVSGSGVADWLVWYQERFSTAADFVASFLGGRRPEDSAELYRRISPFYQADKIKTPLLLAVGDKDTRLADATRFYEALKAAGAPVTFVVFPGATHDLTREAVKEYVDKSIDLFKTAGGKK